MEKLLIAYRLRNAFFSFPLLSLPSLFPHDETWARPSCALSKDVPIESVNRVLGYTNISTEVCEDSHQENQQGFDDIRQPS